MKILTILLAFLVIAPKLIEKDGVDDVKRGMAISKFLEAKNKTYTIKKEILTLEGRDYPIYNVYENSEKIYAVEPSPEGDKVDGIWVYGGKFKTKLGIGVGNTLGELRKKYTLVEVAVAEGSVAVFVEEIDISFVLDTSKIKYKWWNERKLEDLKNKIKIELIIV